MNEPTHSEEGKKGVGDREKKSFIGLLWQKEWAEEKGGEASVVTVIVMSLKGSIIAARACKHNGGREDRKSTIITEGGGGPEEHRWSQDEKYIAAKSEGGKGRR